MSYDAQAAAEPGDEHFVVVDLFGGLVRAVLMARFDAVSFRCVECRDRHRTGFFRDIDHPHKCIRHRRALARFFVGYDHDIAVHELPRDRQGRVDRRGVGGRPVEAADEFRTAHVDDIQDHETAVPVARVEPVAAPDWVVALMRGAFPRRCLAAPIH